MHKNEKLTELNIVNKEATGHSDVPVDNVEFELPQRLADRVVRDAEEIASGIRREAESEAARLIENANRRAQGIVDKAQKLSEAAAIVEEKTFAILRQSKQKTMAIETEAISGATGSRKKEDIKKNLIEMLGKIQEELQPSLDYLVEKARTLEEELGEAKISNKATYVAEPPPPVPIVAECEAVNEPQSKPEEANNSVKATESDYSTRDLIESVEALVATEIVATKNTVLKKDPGLWEGKVEIHIAPPVVITRLLGISRYLENTLNIKVLKTSGSSNTGMVIIISLDKPLPLLKLLREMPNVEEVKIVEDENQSADAEQSDVKKISVILGRSAA